jgi:murein L,D-transpeptidase YcbB/YkuD
MSGSQQARTVAVLVALALAGCGAQDEPPKAKTGTTAGGGEPTASAGQPAAAAQARRAEVPSLDDLAVRLAEAASRAAAAEQAVASQLDKEAGPDRKVIEATCARGELRFYDRAGALNADGEALLQALTSLERHGLDKASYRLTPIDEATRAVGEALQGERQVLLGLDKQPRAGVAAAAAALWIRGGEGGMVQLSRAGADQLDGNGRLALAAVIDPLAAAVQTSREALVRADRELVRAATRYVIDQVHARRAHPANYTGPNEVRKMAEKHAAAIAKVLADGKGKLGDAFKRLWPRHPQYPLLLGAWDSYKKLADAGGWKPLPKLTVKSLQKGYVGPLVTALRERLQVEGYSCGEGDRFDDTLLQAVKTYQGRHQLDEDGVVSKTVWAELDVPVERRMQQIGLSMQRLRESEARDAGDDSFFIWVNIAFQVLWVYQDGAPIDRHKVIVGNNDVDTDQQTQIRGKINRTKMFSHKMLRVVLAPKWFPTPRVVELELQPKLASDPSFLEREGYVREVKPDGSETWYQKGGKSNALGNVKFFGPNKYNIYLHDTPFREKFSATRRPFSHGCIRVHKPLELADLLLSRDNGMTSEQIRDIVKEGEEKAVNLKTPIPVHIDYASVAVDEEGHVIFGSDVYGYDRAFFDGVLPVEEAKTYKAGSTRGL